jgi:hypothetical protein
MTLVAQRKWFRDAALRRVVRLIEMIEALYRVLSTLVLVFVHCCAASGKASPSTSFPIPQEAARTAEAVRVEQAPRLDGTLNDPLWRLAKPICSVSLIDGGAFDSRFES